MVFSAMTFVMAAGLGDGTKSITVGPGGNGWKRLVSVKF